MVQLSDYYDARDQLVSFMETDLLGPSAPDEVIADPPATRYVCGALFPKASGSVSPEDDDSGGSADRDYDETGAPDPAVAMSNVRYPSSCGMTFAVDTNVTDSVEVQVQCGRYDEIAEEDAGDTESTKPGSAWRRTPIEAGPFSIDLRAPDPSRRTPIGDTGLTLFWRVRSADEQGAVSVTVVLLNERTAPASGLRDAYCFFQPRLTVFAPDASGVPFVNRPWRGSIGVDKDADTYRLLYRSCPNYGVGHGCSVDWERTSRGLELKTTFAPRHELLISESNPRIPLIPMRLLAQGRRETTIPLLRGLVDGYSTWIQEQREALADLDESLRPIGGSHLADCEEAAARIAEGVDVLERDDSALQAFALANEAMADQRSRLVRIDEERPGQDLESVECEWRPFQVAFLLLCLPGIVDRSSPQRELVDLLWFPTGGGKTEAYLGLIAFTVFLRRLRSGEAGVTALMRYTLRLLTAQQFERAAALILACEAIRKRRDDLGTRPISIGLWVGRGGTPNTLADAARALNNLKANRPAGDKGNPIQLHRCPRCGTRLGPNNYWIRDARPRSLVVNCKRPGCDFEKGLPVHVVDEDIYAVRPTLLVGTVDKFASLPWNEKTGSIFNIGEEDPPELVIQDELHLISGPLGTLTGLYETAVDLLSESPDGSMPKVVASTATIRRADDQSLGLFARDLRQFPPPGLTIENSYFATTAPRESRGSRLYLGLMAPGSSHATLMIRAYAALLQSAAEGEMPEEVRDAYWTLVGYFNSLRVLGGARMQVQDDVQDRMALLARAQGAAKRDVEMIVEMTSRESSATIPDRLRQMKVAYPNGEAIDVLLATNMISVGVDIDRFSLMAIMGQPQSAAEYIQASSRVGRQHPGLVVTLFNSARSRDRSHYESFRTFHNAMYRQVEATSVTPFSPRARDRGLGPVFVALARLTIPGLRANDSAARVGDFVDDLHALRDRIVSRAVRVDEREAEATREQLDAILSDWVTRASTQSQLSYSNPHHPDRALLVDASADMEPDGSIPALWSLRDVDQTSNLYLVRAR